MAAQGPYFTMAGCCNLQCGRKVGHPSRVAASREAARLEAVEHVKFNVYTCSWCGKFHVGHVQKNGAWLRIPDGPAKRFKKRKKQRRIRIGGKSANIASVFQSRKLEFCKIRDGRPLQGGRVESSRRRH